MKKIMIMAFCLITFNLFAETTIPKSVEVLGDQRVKEYTALVNTLIEIQVDAEMNKPKFSTPTEYIKYINEKWYNNYEFDISPISNYYEKYENSHEHMNSFLKQSELSDEMKNWIIELNEKMENASSEENLDEIIFEFATQVTSLEVSSQDRIVGESLVLMINGTYKVAGDAFVRNNDSETLGRSFWSGVWAGVKCVVGTAGLAGGGAVAGAAVGTVTLPVIGTVSGTALGLWSGAATGIASFCM